MTTFHAGERVEIRLPDGHSLYTTLWWPKTGPVTGTVQKVFDQIRNRSADGLHTMHIPMGYLVRVG